MGSGDENDNGFSCCNAEQKTFCTLYVLYVISAILTWKSIISKPMRLIAVFIHEMSHAVACWITGGDVRGIEVYDNEGGVTKYIGGCRILIIPAGYVGCGFWAMVFVILSGGRKTATFAGAIFTFALLISLCYSPNRVMVYLNLTYAIVTLAFILVEWYVFTPILQFVILFYGVFIGIFAIADIHDDLISRSVNGSDAFACYEITGCYPRCVGIQWAICAIFFQIFGIWLALVEMSEECEDSSWFECARTNLRLPDFDFDSDFDFDKWWDGGP